MVGVQRLTDALSRRRFYSNAIPEPSATNASVQNIPLGLARGMFGAIKGAEPFGLSTSCRVSQCSIAFPSASTLQISTPTIPTLRVIVEQVQEVHVRPHVFADCDDAVDEKAGTGALARDLTKRLSQRSAVSKYQRQNHAPSRCFVVCVCINSAHGEPAESGSHSLRARIMSSASSSESNTHWAFAPIAFFRTAPSRCRKN